MKTIQDILNAYSDFNWIKDSSEDNGYYLTIDGSRKYNSCYISIYCSLGKLIVAYFPNGAFDKKEISPNEIGKFHKKEMLLSNFK